MAKDAAPTELLQFHIMGYKDFVPPGLLQDKYSIKHSFTSKITFAI